MSSGARARAGAVAVTAALLPALLAACGGGADKPSTAASATSTFPQSNGPANLNPADFTTQIDNPYFPLPLGAQWHVRVTDQEGTVQHEVITVTDRTRRMGDGVTARVVHDLVSEGGKPVETTNDWYAQDKHGNVWYFGEDTAEIKPNGQRDTSGSFEAGVNGADAGVAMLAQPTPGQTYREEYYAGHAEDRSRVLALDQQAEVPFGHFRDVILTEDYSPVEPNVLELKMYAPGIGQVLAQTVSGGSEREELISFEK
ncbi:MAG TPA: hypothetical protein VLB79_11795 [Solirubrobacterales bacterium]|nr:hypothetical protein [Solirubrobacterales bacterium]